MDKPQSETRLMTATALRIWAGALLCLCLTAWPCFGGEEWGAAQVVPYGGRFLAERAGRVAETAAWLDGLERAAETLAGLDAVRLAGLDAFQRQALAAGLDMVEVRVDSRAADATLPDGEGDKVAVARVTDVAAGRVAALLADADGRERYESVILALRRLTPEALRLADTGRSLRVLRAQAVDSVSGAARSGHEDASADEPVIARLDWLVDHLEAYALYRRGLDRNLAGEAPCAAAEPAPLELVDEALALAPDELPLRLARAELLLRQDRFRAAAQALHDVPEPPPAAGGTAGAERRLVARALEARALAQLRSGRPTLAESDLDAALILAPERAALWLGRGAARQMRERFGPMCDDYHRACVLGLCRGLAAARERGQCLNDGKES